MLRGMTAKQFFEWIAFDELEPFGEERDDIRTASIVQMIHNVNVKAGHQKKLSDFILKFGDPQPHKQTWQQQKALFLMMMAGHTQAANAEVGKEG